MTARRIIVPGAMPSRDANGRALPAKLRFYEAGTALTTPAIIYSNEALTVPHAFPILSDAAGRWPAMWADDSETFDVGWSDQVFDRQIAVFSDLSPADDAILASAALAEAAADEAAETLEELNETLGAALDAATAAATATATAAATAAATSAGIALGAETTASTAAGIALGAQSDAESARDLAEQYRDEAQAIVGFDPDDFVPNTRTVTGGGLLSGQGGDLGTNRVITLTASTAAQVQAGTDTTTAVIPSALIAAAAFQTLTDAATINWDAALGFNARVTLGGDRTMAAPTNLFDGITYSLAITQDGTGSRAPSWDAIFDWGDIGAPTLSTGAGKVDFAFGIYSAATGKLHMNFRKAAT